MGEPATCFQFYMTLFNEANLVNLLETVLFQSRACQGLEEAVVDLADYCVRQITEFLAEFEEGEVGNKEKVGFDERMS